MNQATKQPQNGNGPRFGAGIDPREAGRRGGIASGVSRRLRPQRELEAKIASTRNGAAIAVVYKTQLERDRALEHARIAADRDVMRLMDMADHEREEIASLRERKVEVVERINALVQREAELRAKAETPEGLAEILADVPEERLERALIALGHEVGEEPAG